MKRKSVHWVIMVDFRITYALPMYSQPPKSRPRFYRDVPLVRGTLENQGDLRTRCVSPSILKNGGFEEEEFKHFGIRSIKHK